MNKTKEIRLIFQPPLRNKFLNQNEVIQNLLNKTSWRASRQKSIFGNSYSESKLRKVVWIGKLYCNLWYFLTQQNPQNTVQVLNAANASNFRLQFMIGGIVAHTWNEWVKKIWKLTFFGKSLFIPSSWNIIWR